MKTKRKKRRLIGPSFIITVALIAMAVCIFFSSGGSLPNINSLLINLSNVEDEDIRAAFSEMIEKNPETVKYVKGFEEVTEYPEYIDLSEELEDGGIPLLMQWDSRWGYCRYGAGLIGYTGCGPTCLSMVLLGLTGDEKYNPAYVAKFATDSGYCIYGNGTAWTLFSDGAESLGLTAKELPLSETGMEQELDAGRPIICIMGPGDFTDSGHYIIVTGYSDGDFTVLDPYRKANCEKNWDYDTLAGQIRNLWSYDYEG